MPRAAVPSRRRGSRRRIRDADRPIPPLRSASPLAVKWGLPEDVWFHVDKMSSAHVYMRVKKGQTWDDLTEEELEDCAQLVKANSIQGNKENNVWIVYTPWANLKKLPRMEVGQVGYHDLKLVRRIFLI